MNQVLNLIILGPQGSGKGTQAELLVKKYDLAFLGAGDLLREVAKMDTPLGREVHETINVKGLHMRSEVISQIIKEKLETIPKEQGVILESYPRNLEQYADFKKFWPETGRGDYTVLFIELTEEEAVKRMMLRKRFDDNEETIKKRLELFYSLTLPMIEEMKKDGTVITIDGAPRVEHVHQEILSKLNLSPVDYDGALSSPGESQKE